MAQAKGFFGQLYERKQRYQEVQQLTNEAIFLSQEDIGLLYLWEWQQGRILQAQQKFAPAKMAYQQALEHLHPIKTSVIIGQRNAQEVFRERIRPVYFALADILLQQAATISAPKDKKPLLIQAINRIEQLKAAELQDYFQDECVAKTRTNIKKCLLMQQYCSTKHFHLNMSATLCKLPPIRLYMWLRMGNFTMIQTKLFY
jgi:tetratricopeptide (TPR) repeat protein